MGSCGHEDLSTYSACTACCGADWLLVVLLLLPVLLMLMLRLRVLLQLPVPWLLLLLLLPLLQSLQVLLPQLLLLCADPLHPRLCLCLVLLPRRHPGKLVRHRDACTQLTCSC